MKNITKKWLDFAQGDLEAAEVLLKSGKTNWSHQLCVLHCHQAIEKILKAVLVEHNKEVRRIHDLVKLMTDSNLSLPPEMEEYIKTLSPHYQPPRYPDIPYRGPVVRYNKTIATKHFQNTKKLFLWIQRKLMSKK